MFQANLLHANTTDEIYYLNRISPPKLSEELFRINYKFFINILNVLLCDCAEAPSIVRIDLDLQLYPRDSIIRVQWRSLTSEEKQSVDGIRVKYRRADITPAVWKTSDILHRDTSTYELAQIQPNTKYIVDLEFVSKSNAKVVSGKPAEILTPNDRYSFKVC